MTARSWRPPEDPRRQRTRRLIVALGLSIVALVLTLADRAIFHALRVEYDAFKLFEVEDSYQILRQFGFYPTWLIVGVGFILLDGRRLARAHGEPRAWMAPPRNTLGLPTLPAMHARGILLILATGLSGLAAEIIKAVIRRTRPEPYGFYVFDWPTSKFDPGLGLASSHAAVAFAAAFMLGRLLPGTAVLWIALACGCAWTRFAAGAHFATDVLLAIILSWWIARSLWRLAPEPLRDGDTLGIPRFSGGPIIGRGPAA